MRSLRRHTLLGTSFFASLVALGACSSPMTNDGAAGDGTDMVSDGRRDVQGDLADAMCEVDNDCNDMVFCNGIERCAPGAANADERGCVLATPQNPCLTGQRCNEAMMRCDAICSQALDADGDGHRATACGGDDCDDADPNRFPGNPEVCDAMGHDEDCDANSFGLRDTDMDGFVDHTCCNTEMSGTQHCGDDCNDSRPNVHPSLAETCDDIDNNCDGTVDEGVQRTFYPDTDGDGYGDSMAPMSMQMHGCIPPMGFAEQGNDCDDHASEVHPGALEQCDSAMVDENCDGSANPTSLCACNGDITRPCATATGQCSSGTERCVNGSWGLCSIGPTPEICNGLDDDCDGDTDEGLSVTCYPDGDNDGYSDAGAMANTVCPVPGRDGFAGCPPNQTNRPPTGVNIDCNDTNSTISPGQPELCDPGMVDENCDGFINPASLCMCTEGQSRPCMASGTCGAGNQTCSGGRFSACSVNPVAESCNAIDDDCDGMTDEGLTITCYPDNDNDGFAPMGASAISSCPVMGRAYVGGCPTGQTNVAPAPTTVDCNDTNATINPAATETCDSAMVDENCDGTANPSTLCACSGTAMRACPLSGACAAGTQTCAGGSWGSCSISPLAESCNALDDDCDGMIDEGLTVQCYPDGDNDGFAAMSATASPRCPVSGREAFGGCPTATTNRAPTTAANTDCNDGIASINPAAPEVCDAAMADENCDGTANPSTLCMCSGSATRMCTLPGACAAGSQSCTSGAWGACSIGPVSESCNGVDDNCNGMTDEGLTITCYADADNDGYAAMGASAVQSCAATGRTAVGGCPTNQTNRAPTTGNVDCIDTNASVNPVATEQCDTAMLDENCDGAANPMTLCACTGTATRSCSMAGLAGPCAAGTQTCASGNWGTCSIQPVTETCNGTDDDCDGTVDEGLTVTCYADPDNDGYAAMGATSAPQCAAAGREFVGGCPVGYTNRAGSGSNVDCAAMDPARYPTATERCNTIDEDCDGMIDEGVALTFYRDADGDGFGTTSGSMTMPGCTPPAGYVTSNTDCNDSSTAIHPGAPETCNSVDDDCNGMTDEGVTRTFYRDADGDGFGLLSSPTIMASCTAPTGYTADSTDCNDSCNSCHPGGFELCDGIDNNCTGGVDEGATITCYADADNDFYPPMGATSISTCAVVGRDLAGGCPTGRTYRMPTTGNVDCNDSAASVNPGATELCDGAMVDENCDGSANPTSLCTCSGSGTRACALPGACAAGTQTCTAGAWSACTVAPTTEVCDGVDNDCDGMTDENTTGGTLTITCYLDNDSDGYGRGSMVARCTDSTRMGMPFNGCPTGYTANATDCNDANASMNPGITETCNGIDDDCDGMVDESLTTNCYVDADGDTYGVGATSTRQCTDASMARMPYGGCPIGYTNRNGDCADMNASARPTATEVCNGIDDDCDGMIDEGVTTNYYPDADGDGFGATGGMVRQACSAPMGMVANNTDCNDSCVSCQPGGTEVCDSLDNNCNGMTDEGVTVACYVDADNDTYSPTGSPAATQCPVSGRTSWGGCRSGYTNRAPMNAATTDCLDTNAARNPGETEICNMIDDDCDGMTDEGVAGTYYPDGDGDGYGRMAGSPITACAQPIGYAPNNLDCDDTNNQKAPGLGEICDGLDNNCNGTVDDQTLTDTICAATSGSGGTAVCRAGQCRLISCAIGLADCDGSRSNGCEIDIRTDSNNCGACGISCGGGQCFNGRCDRPTTVSAGKYHTCATRGTGEVSCWGNNGDYQIGDGTNFDRDTPVAVLNITANAVQVVGGDNFSCARMANGTVFCWGANFSGQIGNGMTGGDTSMSIGARWSTPQQVRGASGSGAMYLNDAVELAAGGSHVCARRTGGTVVCWGDNQSSQLGDAMSMHTDCSGVAGWQDCTTIPLTVPGIVGATRIGSGSLHSCAIISGGGVRCWGSNAFGQLGDGTTTNGTTPVVVAGGFVAVELAAYESGTCARLMAGGVRCWGRNNQGQIGDGTTTDRLTATAVMLPATDAVEIDADAGGNHVCARRSGGVVMCWGRGIDGQLGYSDTPTNQSTPVAVRNITSASSLGIGGWHSCAFLNDGRLQCWGLNSDGQIGDGTPAPRFAPATTINLVNLSVVQESAGGHHTCARRASGAIGCWGDNTYGQLGDGTNTDALTVVQTSGQSTYIDLSAGSWHTCGVRQAGTVHCWGRNQLGQLGDGTTTDHNTPTQVGAFTNAWRVATGGGHSCALLTTGSVLCWGDNTYGQLGDNTTTARTTPVSVVGLGDAVDIEAGGRHTCARRATGLVVCWGQGAGGRLGDGTGAQRNVPTMVSGLDDATMVELGELHSCALRAGGTVSCWGTNFYGQIGDNSAIDRLTPVAVSGLADVAQIAAGYNTSCARRTNGTVACWGHNNSGAIGDGSTSSRPIPSNTFGINNAQSITVGGDVSGTAPIEHTCGHLANGTVGCWGVNNDGELGDGTTSQRLTPVVVLNLP